MSAQVRASDVLSRTEDALGAALDRTSASVLGRELGRAHTTISRDWRSDLTRWPWADGIRLLCRDEALRREHLAALAGAPVVLPDCTPETAARDLVRRCAREIDVLVGRLSDGRIDARESQTTDAELDQLQTTITQLRALLRAQRKGAH